MSLNELNKSLAGPVTLMLCMQIVPNEQGTGLVPWFVNPFISQHIVLVTYFCDMICWQMSCYMKHWPFRTAVGMCCVTPGKRLSVRRLKIGQPGFMSWLTIFPSLRRHVYQTENEKFHKIGVYKVFLGIFMGCKTHFKRFRDKMLWRLMGLRSSMRRFFGLIFVFFTIRHLRTINTLAGSETIKSSKH